MIFKNNTKIIISLLLLLLPSAAWSDPWPTTQFEVITGSVFDGSNNKNWIADNFEGADDSASVPLTPALKTLIENYLFAVSTEFEAWGLPAPRLDIMERADGVNAYRVQYYDPGDGYALFGPNCTTTERSTIHINAKRFTQNGRITNKGYIDLAHELFHAVETNSTFGRSECGKTGKNGKWITEGIAEAIGQDISWQIIGFNNRNMEAINQQHRWGMRTYGQPLAVPFQNGSILEYQTSSFWRYLAELKYLQLAESKGGINKTAKPGPDKVANFDQGKTNTDYRYVVSLLKESVPGKGPDAELKWLEKHLETNFNSELSHIYINFVSVLAEYGRYRVEGQLSRAERETLWRKNVFWLNETADNSVSCEPMLISLSTTHITLDVDLGKVATRCIELDVGDTGTPLVWIAGVVAKNDTLLKQVRLGMAGGRQVITSGAIKPLEQASGHMASWGLLLESNRKQYLLLANVAQEPWLSKPQTIQLHLSLEGLGGDLATSQPGTGESSSTSQPAPGPAGAAETRQQSSEKMGYQSLGAGSASWSYQDATEFCTRKTRARGNCHTDATLSFRTAAPPNLALPHLAGPDAMGSMGSQMMNIMSGGSANMMHFMEFEDGSDGTSVEMVIPDIDYGFKGTIGGVDIKVSAAHESAGLRAWKTTAVSPTAPCIWGNPTGRVTIDEFTPHILRGRYEAALISTELPPAGFRGRCPTKPVVKQVSGTFAVAAPWMDDNRQAEDMTWVHEDIGTSLNEVMPMGANIEMGETEGEAPTIRMGGNVVTESDFDRLEDEADEYGPEDCKCTCEEYQQGLKVTRKMMMGGTGLPEGETMRLLTCSSYCLADVLKRGCQLELD